MRVEVLACTIIMNMVIAGFSIAPLFCWAKDAHLKQFLVPTV